MDPPSAASLGDVADAVLQAQELLSSLVISSESGTIPSTGRKNIVPNEYSAVNSGEISENQRQRRVELELYQKITNLRNSLLDFGEDHGIRYVTYGGEHHLKEIMDLITKDLSEPYSIYTYRYFIYQWPKLCYLALDQNEKIVGTIVCKMENTKGPQIGRNDYIRRGYIAMLAVDKTQRRKKIGTALVVSAVEALMTNGCDECACR
ncbi:uncharacterized protein LOC129588546 isoform X2 [Paramacrobiotus metropolitanus]|uniref:uncharacterized protein LOC129588546 isoform X2 n=1 Tax=Paramacrobiotus metropolitanus TaxID=2943436 RepID=UPI002445B612|nr:uncharacterized protein LOC129588546 isoform X2 [Paramacrobiotus metropolitanus]